MKDRSDYFWGFALLCGTFWFCADLVIDQAVPFFRDLTNYFYPLRYSLFESYRLGELPLWDRHFAQGFPNLAAFQSGAFYPPHFILALLPFFTAIRALFVFHFLVAAMGTYILFRQWRYSHDLAFVAAVLFTFGGTIVSLSNLLNHFQSAVWLPWILLTWERVLETPGWRRFLCFTVLSAMQFLAGSPEMAALSTVLTLLHGFQLRAASPQISWMRLGWLLLAAHCLMLALIMVQLLPTAELAMQSRRVQSSIPAEEAMMWSLKPWSLVNLIFLDKEVANELPGGMQLFFSRHIPLFASTYMSAIFLFGTILWGYYSSRREKLFLCCLGLLSLALALGNNALIYPFLLRHFPVVAVVRFPEKFFFLTNAFLVLVTLRGLRSFVADPTTRLRVPAVLLGLICVVWLGLYALLTFHSEIIADFIVTHSSIAPLSEIHAKATVSVLTNLQRQVVLSLAVCCLLLLFKANKLRPLLFSVLFASVVYVDLTWAHKSFLFPVEPGRFEQTPPVILPAATRMTRLFFYPAPHDLHPAFFTVQGRPRFEQAVALSYQNLLPNVGVINGHDYFQEIDALGRRPYGEFLAYANQLDFKRQIKLLSVFNVRHVMSFHELPQTDIRLIRRFPEYFSWLYEIPTVVPRAYMVNRVWAEKDTSKALERLASADFDPLREVVLNSDVPVRRSSGWSAKADIQRYENNSVTISAEANGDGFLILADAFYPGWKAYIDGQETPIMRANHFYRAVAVPSGNHRIEFKYEPLSFKIGAFISILTVVSIIIVSLTVAMRKRQLAPLHPVPTIVEVLQSK